MKIGQNSHLSLNLGKVFLIYRVAVKAVQKSDRPEAGMETYLTIEELADYLRLAEQTIRRWVLNHEIPYHKIKRVIRFRISEIEKWIDEGGYSLPKEQKEDLEGYLFDDVISLDELAEMEQAEEEAEDEV